MAVITPDTFNPLRSYIGVRLQQGVPLVDADWNEAHDVRKFEVQAFLKWFVGNGVPEGNDGFRITGLDPAVVGDFVIRRGVGAAPDGTNNLERGLRYVGRILVDGMDVLIEADIDFRDQPLHISQGESATALASLLGVPTIAEVPNITGTVVVYLDVWERLVTPMEDPSLVHSGLGVESCARLKREWVVRTREGSSVPTPNNPNDADDFIAGHSYYALATITHLSGVPITSEAITDQREQRLLVPPATLLEDLFGPVDYRRGQGRPLMSFREAINALLRGELPTGPETPIAPSPTSHDTVGRGTFLDAAQGLITTWTSNRTGTPQVFAARLQLAVPHAGFNSVRQITDGPGRANPHATLLNTGETLIVYQTTGETENIMMKRGTLAMLPQSEEKEVTATPARERNPFAVAVGGQILMLWHTDAGNTWQFIRYDVETNSFLTEATSLSTIGASPSGSLPSLHAARDSTNTVWVAFSAIGGDIIALRVPPGAPPGSEERLFSTPSNLDALPFVVVDHSDNVWVFWTGANPVAPISSIWYRRFLRATMTWESAATEVPGTTMGHANFTPAAVSDPEGGIWLFWQSHRSGNADIWYVQQNPVTQVWSEPRQITTGTEADSNPFILRGTDGSFWLFWGRNFGGNGELFYRGIFRSI